TPAPSGASGDIRAPATKPPATPIAISTPSGTEAAEASTPPADPVCSATATAAQPAPNQAPGARASPARSPRTWRGMASSAQSTLSPAVSLRSLSDPSGDSGERAPRAVLSAALSAAVPDRPHRQVGGEAPVTAP